MSYRRSPRSRKLPRDSRGASKLDLLLGLPTFLCVRLRCRTRLEWAVQRIEVSEVVVSPPIEPRREHAAADLSTIPVDHLAQWRALSGRELFAKFSHGFASLHTQHGTGSWIGMPWRHSPPNVTSLVAVSGYRCPFIAWSASASALMSGTRIAGQPFSISNSRVR